MAEIISIDLDAMDNKLNILDTIEQELRKIAIEIDKLPFSVNSIESKGPHAAKMKAFQTTLRDIVLAQANLVDETEKYLKNCKEVFKNRDNPNS